MLTVTLLVSAAAGYAVVRHRTARSSHVDATSRALTAVQDPLRGTLYPGGPAVPLNGTLHNPTGEPVSTTAVSVRIGAVHMASARGGTCDASDYTLVGAAMPVVKTVAPHSTVRWSGATIAFRDKPVNQDGCRGATVELAYNIATRA